MKQLTGDDAPCSNLCYCERAANRAEIKRLLAALQWIADQVDNVDGDLDDVILCANKAIAPEQRGTAPAATDPGPASLHYYLPSIEHRGDCVVCGHVESASVHKQRGTGNEY